MSIDRESFIAALQRLRDDSKKPLPARPYQFVGLSGIGCVCPSEYRDIMDRTGLYAKGAPLDLGDAWYGKGPSA